MDFSALPKYPGRENDSLAAGREASDWHSPSGSIILVAACAFVLLALSVATYYLVAMTTAAPAG